MGAGITTATTWVTQEATRLDRGNAPLASVDVGRFRVVRFGIEWFVAVIGVQATVSGPWRCRHDALIVALELADGDEEMAREQDRAIRAFDFEVLS